MQALKEINLELN